MKLSLRRIIQGITVIIVHMILLFILGNRLPGFDVTSLRSLFVFTVIYAVAQAAFYWVFVNFLSWLPTVLYPLVMFVINGILIAVVGNRIPGVTVDGWQTGLWIVIFMTVINAILGELLTLDEDDRFDRAVIKRMVGKRGKVKKTDEPGILYLELDGLGEDVFERAIKEGHMPHVKKWLDTGEYRIIPWETDMSAQTGAMQAGILLGNNKEIPSFRWWDRTLKKTVMTGDPREMVRMEAELSNGDGLLANGGASRGNMYSGDATESFYTMSTLMKKDASMGPGFYSYLISPYVIFHIITRMIIEIFKEYWQAAAQRRRKDKYIVKARNWKYGLIRAMMGPFLHDMITYSVIGDILRGVPAIYALYSAYDDVGHFAGSDSPDALEALTESDRYIARIQKAIEDAPRPYHIVLLADHGQTTGPTFINAFNTSLEQIVKDLIKGDAEVLAILNSEEAWDNINAVASQTTNDNTRTSKMLKRMLKSKEKDGVVMMGPDRDPKETEGEEEKQKNASLMVYASGGLGAIYFTDSEKRLTMEEIQDRYPDLILGLANHPGIGFVLVDSKENGALVATKGGIRYLKDDKIEGIDPLKDYGPNAADHARRESSFKACPDIVVNARLDPATDEVIGFEDQVSHHGSMGGPQTRPFIMFPATLKYNEKPIIGAEQVHKVLKSWRYDLQPRNK
jgi:uncharacterized membrane protein YvlD (DUF360 family)